MAPNPHLNPELDRRRFLGITGGAVAAGLVGAAVPLGLGRAAAASDGGSAGAAALAAAAATRQGELGPAAARTLVVVEMEGGNDALNTLVPAVGAYHDLRPTIGLGDDELLTWAGLDYGVHPGLGSLSALWDAGRLAGVYGVGLPEQSRSHFTAQDAWRSARPGEPATSGWLGRWLEATDPALAGGGGLAANPLRAIALGRSTLAAQGETGRPVAVQSVDGYRLLPPDGDQAVVAALLAMASPEIAGPFGQAQRALPETVESVEQLQGILAAAGVTAGGGSSAAGDDGGNGAPTGGDDTATLFAAARAIIQADVGTQVLYLTVGSFDTHASQPARHDVLLREIADGISGLFAGLAETGHADRTVAIAVSEFGRRAAENASQGTDHGTGGLALVAGPAVASSTVLGQADVTDLDDGDLRTVIDARGIYDGALRWLGASDELVDAVIGHDWQPLDLLTI